MAGKKKTWEKERQRLRLRELVFEAQDRMVEAQIANAIGIKYLIAREKKSGKFTKLTAEQAEKILAQGQESDSEVIEVWEERPATQAFKELMDQAIDKASQRVDLDANVKGDLVFRWEK